jgi:hypothetical protein
MTEQSSAVSKPRRVQLNLDGLLVDGYGINFGGLVFVICIAIVFALTDSRWWVPFAVLGLIPVVMLFAWLRGRLDKEFAGNQRNVMLERIDKAASPSMALAEIIKEDLRRSGFAVRKSGVHNGCIIETPHQKLLVEVTGPPGHD